MRTRSTLLHLSPAANTRTPSHLVISLAGEASPGQQRPKIGLVPVVDRSGSMGSQDKLGVATRALGYLSTYLGEDDEVALVAFDTTSEIVMSPRPCDQAGSQAFASALELLHPRATTNLEAALRDGIRAATAMSGDALVRIVVLTDGRSNVGLSDKLSLSALLRDIPAHVSVSFLGLGADCDHDLLSALAQAGRGNYGFIESADRSADVLGAEVGGLLETEVRALTVSVRARTKYLSLQAPLAMDAALDDGEYTVEVGSLLVGQSRHVVFPVTLAGPRRDHARPVTVAEVVVRGRIDDVDVEFEMLPKVHFGGPEADWDSDLETVIDLARVAQAQREAEQAAAAGDFGRASDALSSLVVSSGAAMGLQASLSTNYSNPSAYGASATLRSSSSHALAGSLSGSDVTFDALAARTFGAYTTAGQRDIASATSYAARTATNPAAGMLTAVPGTLEPTDVTGPGNDETDEQYTSRTLPARNGGVAGQQVTS